MSNGLPFRHEGAAYAASCRAMAGEDRPKDWRPSKCHGLTLEADQPWGSLIPRLVSTPRAFSFRCRAERSMPMKAAVRETLPPNRVICMARYSRSKCSRASRSDIEIICIEPADEAPPDL